MGFISAMVEKELGERNFAFDSLKSRLNRDMEEKGIVAWDCLLLPQACDMDEAAKAPPRQPHAEVARPSLRVDSAQTEALRI